MLSDDEIMEIFDKYRSAVIKLSGKEPIRDAVIDRDIVEFALAIEARAKENDDIESLDPSKVEEQLLQAAQLGEITWEQSVATTLLFLHSDRSRAAFSAIADRYIDRLELIFNCSGESFDYDRVMAIMMKFAREIQMIDEIAERIRRSAKKGGEQTQ